MTATCIPYTHIPHSSTLLTDYLYHFDKLSDFYHGSSFDPESFATVSSELRESAIPRTEMAEILTRQNLAFGCSEPTLANIRRLAQPGTFAVVTGQQVGLFSGPAFTLYKALTTVRLANFLSEQGLPCVPVFWLATEDHDLEEVAEVSTFDEEYNLAALHDSGSRPSPRSRVGDVRHTAEVSEALNQLEALLPPGEPRERLMHDLRDCYKPGATWGESFGKFLTRLFGRWGVILLDQMDEGIHRLSSRVVEQALDRTAELRAGILKNSRALVDRGYHAQVHVPEDSTLVFVISNGDRLALHERNGRFFIGEGESEEISLADLHKLLAEQPLDFSPNVLLRPLVQDTLLPTVTYVAGPSELAYHGQAQFLYKALDRPQPVIYARAAFTLLDARVERLMEKYRVTLEDALDGEEPLRNKVAAGGLGDGWAERFDRSEHELDIILDRLQEDVERLDPTLTDTLANTKEKMKSQMEKLRSKLSRAALGRSELLARHMLLLSGYLVPRKDLQERRVGGAYFLGRAGYELLDKVLAQIQFGCSDHQTLKY